MARTNDNDAATIYWSGLTERWRRMKEMCGVVWMDRTTCISRISTFYMSLRSHVVCDARATALLAHPDPWTTRTADRRSQPGYLMENREETALWWRLNFSMAMQGSRCGSDLPSDSQTPTPRITPSNSVYVNTSTVCTARAETLTGTNVGKNKYRCIGFEGAKEQDCRVQFGKDTRSVRRGPVPGRENENAVPSVLALHGHDVARSPLDAKVKLHVKFMTTGHTPLSVFRAVDRWATSTPTTTTQFPPTHDRAVVFVASSQAAAATLAAPALSIFTTYKRSEVDPWRIEPGGAIRQSCNPMWKVVAQMRSCLMAARSDVDDAECRRKW
ncbi:hypothetical protein BD410DRAFT_809279 [Rickenella mellea]|uniref:Uncharacterized protein n=1 Tax=Rickenella mellea TaxID=50990 RepID=A0A4Y7PHZ5_9AGAM|nr:hypothetical protein BD410DRAFT_809279 [Rickenella mellea]